MAVQRAARGWLVRALGAVIDIIYLRYENQVWFIPVKLDRCTIPSVRIRAGKDIASLHYADLSCDFRVGIEKIKKVIDSGNRSLK